MPEPKFFKALKHNAKLRRETKLHLKVIKKTGTSLKNHRLSTNYQYLSNNKLVKNLSDMDKRQASLIELSSRVYELFDQYLDKDESVIDDFDLYRLKSDVNDEFDYIRYLTEGASGSIFVIKLKRTSKPFLILKVTSDSKATLESLHEATIGTVLMRLTLDGDLHFMLCFLPNFLSSYYLSKKKELSFQEYIKDERYCMISEYIQNSKAFTDLLEDTKSTTKRRKLIASVLVSLWTDLSLAQNEYRFMHYDLHTENVLVQNIKESYKVEKKINDEFEISYKLKIKPVIIDFGQSVVTFRYKSSRNSKERNHIIKPFDNSGRYHTFSDNQFKTDYFYPLFDALHFLHFIINHLIRLKDYELKDEVLEIVYMITQGVKLSSDLKEFYTLCEDDVLYKKIDPEDEFYFMHNNKKNRELCKSKNAFDLINMFFIDPNGPKPSLFEQTLTSLDLKITKIKKQSS